MVVAVVCGGGNGAHVMAGLGASQPGVETRVFTLFGDEAARWRANMADHEFTVDIHNPDKSVQTKVGKPTIVTNDASQCVPGADIIVLALPAFAHAAYLEALAPHLGPSSILVGMPGQAGFELQARSILGDKLPCTLLNFESLPWACRFKEFGRSAEVLGTKGTLMGAEHRAEGATCDDPTAVLQAVIGPRPKLITRGHLLGITLMGTNAYLHPSIMYGKWHSYDGRSFDEAPLFYNGLNMQSAKILSNVSDEVVSIATKIASLQAGVDMGNVSHIYNWYLRCYEQDIENKTSLYTCIKTNKAYAGLTHPMKKTPDGRFVPNFEHRYLTEDIAYGLTVMHGIAEIINFPTPYMDEIIMWAQAKLGKTFLVDGKLVGEDVKETRSPQRYGITTLDQLLAF